MPEKERVEVLYHADDVVAKRFGGEGTGGQSFFEYPWKVGETYRFFVKAAPEDKKTSFSGYIYLPEKKAWKHLVTFRTITGGTQLESPHSFIEDFRRDGKIRHADPPRGVRQRLGPRRGRQMDAAGESPIHASRRNLGSQGDDRRRRGKGSLLSANRRRYQMTTETQYLDRMPRPRQRAAGSAARGPEETVSFFMHPAGYTKLYRTARSYGGDNPMATVDTSTLTSAAGAAPVAGNRIPNYMRATI